MHMQFNIVVLYLDKNDMPVNKSRLKKINMKSEFNTINFDNLGNLRKLFVGQGHANHSKMRRGPNLAHGPRFADRWSRL